jgi:PleD family two-component response regulator
VEDLDLTFTDTQGESRQLTVSGGFIVRVPERGDPPAVLVDPAREALGWAKARGRNRIEAA